VATIYLQLIQNRYMFRRFTVHEFWEDMWWHWRKKNVKIHKNT